PAGAAAAPEGGGGGGGAVQGDEATAAQAQMTGCELQLYLQQYLQQYQGLAAKNHLAMLESLAGFATMAHYGPYADAHALEEFAQWCAAAAMGQPPQPSDCAAAQHSLPSFAGGVVYTSILCLRACPPARALPAPLFLTVESTPASEPRIAASLLLILVGCWPLGSRR
ncbi:unnamed protein product, partial [Prorocentrum cordatum]